MKNYECLVEFLLLFDVLFFEDGLFFVCFFVMWKCYEDYWGWYCIYCDMDLMNVFKMLVLIVLILLFGLFFNNCF